jgi:hypothetical protein
LSIEGGEFDFSHIYILLLYPLCGVFLGRHLLGALSFIFSKSGAMLWSTK